MRAAEIRPLERLSMRLRALRDQKLATELLWLAIDGSLDVLEDGSIGFWTNRPGLIARQIQDGAYVMLERPLIVDPTWSGPREDAALWCSVVPEDIVGIHRGPRGVPELMVRAFTLQLRVLAEEEEAIVPAERIRPRRRGAARLFPRLARRPLS